MIPQLLLSLGFYIMDILMRQKGTTQRSLGSRKIFYDKPITDPFFKRPWQNVIKGQGSFVFILEVAEKL